MLRQRRSAQSVSLHFARQERLRSYGERQCECYARSYKKNILYRLFKSRNKNRKRTAMVVLRLEGESISIVAMLSVFVRRKGVDRFLCRASEKKQQREAADGKAVEKIRRHGD